MKKTIISFLCGVAVILSLASAGTEIAAIGFGNTLPSYHSKTTYKVYYRLSDNSLHWFNGVNWVQLINGTPTILGGQAFAANANIGSSDAYRFGLSTNGTSRLLFGATGRIYTGTATDFIADLSDSIKLKGATIDIDGSVKLANRILGKKGSDVASAGSITLGAGNLFHVTGTTTINEISETGWQSGSIVTLVFDGSLTLTHNATSSGAVPLFLSGSANQSVTANTTRIFQLDGLYWRQIGGENP